MKKLFFIPAVLFVLITFALIQNDAVSLNARTSSNDVISSKENMSYYTLLTFKEKGTETPISGVVGCIGGSYNFNSGAHSYVYLYDIPSGNSTVCGDGPSGYHGEAILPLNGSSQQFDVYLEVNSLDCVCSGN